MRERRLLQLAVLVRGNSQPHIERLLKMQLDRSVCRMQRLAIHAYEWRDRISALLQPHNLGSSNVGAGIGQAGRARLRRIAVGKFRLESDFLRQSALAGPVLQRRVTRAVHRHIRCRRVHIERLPEHYHRLAVRVRLGRRRRS